MGILNLLRVAAALALMAAWLPPPACAASAGLADIHIFPSPWKPGSGDAAFDAPRLTFSNLPAGTKVTLYTIRGQRVWQDHANAAGVLLWSGHNDHRRAVGTGTYIVVFDGGGRKASRRVVVIR